ncbi:MAG: hypothetical protein M1820_008862 [Bogoriella megaspora]|nr:MAG: hypothetical protein M1820_008862 [Bogoriella megaspora]
MFSPEQVVAIEAIERSMSVASLAGALSIISAFAAFPSLRKPINRLIFYATFGNLLTNVATMVSMSGIRPNELTSLCEFQAIFIQWFMPADALWTSAMAINVYLTFFRGYTPSMLHGLEKWYLVICYGIPFTPALTYAIMQATGPYPIYGDAAIWCWVDLKYDWMRVAFFYGPVWVVILFEIGIYVFTGLEIFRRERILRLKERARNDSYFTTGRGNGPYLSGLGAIMKTTELSVTSEPLPLEVFNPLTTTRLEASSTSLREPDYDDDCFSLTSTQGFSVLNGPTDGGHVLAPQPLPPPPPSGSGTRFPKSFGSRPHTPPKDGSNPIFSHGSATKVTTTVSSDPKASRSHSIHHVSVGHDSVVDTDTKSPSTHSLESTNSPERRISDPPSRTIPDEADVDMSPVTTVEIHLPASRRAHQAASSYYKVSLLMFIALFAVWVPSTVNRVYALVVPTEENFSLSFIAAMVLPMQGFWNCLVFVGTSWPELRREFRKLFSKAKQGAKTRHRGDQAGVDLGTWKADRLA